ncbi:nucleoside hydrolase [Occultella glacieicola]|uniref:Nucleoside hydrolase n=1 Tax=Occultella glacieicola TaxID=2518684 RepID=A0ABY2E504_9MICO|nr:nucleoside hydrolase [Occultella glacieicola]TDE95103.1 nucleoside hydrolase [Occultella glacieicola]
MAQQGQRRRAIINTDAKNEADDQYAIVHALLSPTIDVRGLVAAHFGTVRSQRSMEDSRAEIDLILDLLALDREVPVANGAAHALPDPTTPVDSPGARLIIDEAHAETESTLYVAFLGPLTDMASALLLDPSIQDTDTVVIWIGGHHYYDPIYPLQPKVEFNLSNDITAANVVMASRLPVWQVPSSVYRQVAVGYAELDARVAPQGRIGRYLVDQLHEWNATHHTGPIEHRSLGDSPAVGLILNPGSAHFSSRPAPVFAEDGSTDLSQDGAREVLVAESYDTRWLLEDMFHKIARHAGAEGGPR